MTEVNQQKQREGYIDIAKGILIILVVLGHSSFPYSKYIYWFHMPAFFLLSGWFIKQTVSFSALKSNVAKSVRRLLVPYGIYLFFFFLISAVPNLMNQEWGIIGDKLSHVLIGGRALAGVYSIFWFITVLFFSKLFVQLLDLVIKSRWGKLLLSISLLLVGYYEGSYINALDYKLIIPWSLDSVLVVQFYVLLGKEFKELFKYKSFLVLCGLLIISILIGLDITGILNLRLDMKAVNYSNFLMLSIVPMVITGVLLGITKGLRWDGLKLFFSVIGQRSLTIMYLHFFINVVVQTALPVSFFKEWYVFLVIGVFIPLLIDKYVYEKISYLNKLLK